MTPEQTLPEQWEARVAAGGVVELRPERPQLVVGLVASVVLVGLGLLLGLHDGGPVRHALGWFCVVLFGASLVTVAGLLLRPRVLLRATSERLELGWPGQPLAIPWSEVTGATVRTVTRHRRNLYVQVSPAFHDDARAWSSRARRATPVAPAPFRGYPVPGLLPHADDVARWVTGRVPRVER